MNNMEITKTISEQDGVRKLMSALGKRVEIMAYAPFSKETRMYNGKTIGVQIYRGVLDGISVEFKSNSLGKVTMYAELSEPPCFVAKLEIQTRYVLWLKVEDEKQGIAVDWKDFTDVGLESEVKE